MEKRKYFTTNKIVSLAILSALGTPLMFIEIAPVPVAPWLKFDLSDLVVIVSAIVYGPIGACIVAFIKAAINYLIKGSDVGIPLPQFIAFISSLAYSIPFYYTMKLVKRFNNNQFKYKKIFTIILGIIVTLVSIVSIQYLLIPVFCNWFSLPLPKHRLLWVITYLGLIDIIIAALLITFLVKKVDNDEFYLIRFLPVTIGTISLTLLLTILNYLWLTPLYLDLLGAPLPDNMIKFVAEAYAPFNFAKGTILSILFIVLSYRLDKVTRIITGSEDKQIDLN